MTPELADGARNMLVTCGELQPGNHLLVVHERPDLGWYDAEAPAAVVEIAREMGATVSTVEVGGPENTPRKEVTDAIAGTDIVVFFARIGDQDRFTDRYPGKTCVMSYIRNAAGLASAYGRTHHGALTALKDVVNETLFNATEIAITCSLGTELKGRTSPDRLEDGGEVTVRRFPLGVPQPVEGGGFSGKVALARFLTPTGSKVYEPPNLPIEGVVFVLVEAGRITGFEGDEREVAAIRAHYDHVSGFFGIDRDIVHSWHAGIHPGSVFANMAADDPDLWSNSAFTNPRFLHFHTCGDYAPAEICWMVLDATVRADGVPLWEDGRLRLENFEAGRACLATWPVLEPLLADPSQQIGLTENQITAPSRAQAALHGV